MIQEPVFDKILQERIGGGGKWQWKIFLLTTIASNMAWLYFPIFTFNVPKHHCRNLYFESLGWSREEIVRMTTPGAYKIKNYADIESSCERHAMLWLRRAIGNRNVTYNEAVILRGSVYRNLSRIKRFKCNHGISYAKEGRVFNQSLGIEFNIVCDRKYWYLVTTILYSIAMMFGYVVAGILSDKYGRKKIGMIFGSTSLIFGLWSAFTSSILLFSIMRAISGFLISGIWITTNVLVSEVTDKKYRNIFNVLQSIYFTCIVTGGYALIAYFIQEWRFVQLLISLPAATAAFFVWFIPESPRWLLTNGHYSDAREVITDAILMNSGKDMLDRVISMNRIPEGSLKDSRRQFGHSSIHQVDKKAFYCKSSCCSNTDSQVCLLFCHKRVVVRFLHLIIIFIATLTCNYGLKVIDFVFPGASSYLTLFINVLLAAPASIGGMTAFIYFDRKRPHIIAALLVSVFTLINAITIHASNRDRSQSKLDLSKEIKIFVNILAIFITAGVNVLIEMMNLRAMEMFPTYIRNSAYGLIHGLGRIGMAAGLYIQTSQLWAPLPMYLFCFCGVTIALAVYFSDDENGEVLLDTVEQLDRQDVASKTINNPLNHLRKLQKFRRRNSRTNVSLIESEGFPEHIIHLDGDNGATTQL